MTKKPSLVSRFLVLINALLLFALFLIMGGYFPIKGLLPGVLVPVLSFINIGFFFYWILRMRWPFLLFLVFFLLNFQEWNRLYKFPNNAIVVADGFKVMSYNVRLFNQYNWLKETQVPLQIEQFIYAEDPDIICLQEYSSSTAPALIKYPYRYLKTAAAFGNNGVGIFSKFPLLRTGQIDFENSSNGGVYADIRYRKDTLRVYNLHLESFQLQRTDSLVDQNSSARFLNRLDGVYEKQLDQIVQWQHLENFNEYPSVICVDMNNTAFSKAYRNLRGRHVDAFEATGRGFGATYNLGGIPYRIDFIFSPSRIKVLEYTTHEVDLSDHKPISAKLNWD